MYTQQVVETHVPANTFKQYICTRSKNLIHMILQIPLHDTRSKQLIHMILQKIFTQYTKQVVDTHDPANIFS